MKLIYSDDSIIVDKTEDETWFNLRIMNNFCELGFPKEEWINFIESMNKLIEDYPAQISFQQQDKINTEEV